MIVVLLFLFGCIFFAVGMHFLLRPGRLKKRCTQTVQGTVVDYNKKDGDGSVIDDSALSDRDTGIRRPVTQYRVNGETYTAIGPAYPCYTDIHLQSCPEKKGTVEFRDGIIHVHVVRDKWRTHNFNPYERLFPRGTEVTVHYDPDNPGFSYVNDILEEKFMGRIFSFAGLGALAAAVIGLLFM